MEKKFASQGDTGKKSVTVSRLSERCYGYTAEGDPNSGFVVGDEAVLVVDAQATPVMAADVIAKIREVSDLPIRHLVLSHYHAVRVLGASAYKEAEIIASEGTAELIEERGQQDYESEVGRFPRLFRAVESIPGLTRPTRVFSAPITIDLGGVTVAVSSPGRGHTAGDTVAWAESERVLFAGDLVEYGAAPYCGDAFLRDWPRTLAKLRRLNPEAVVPGRGEALQGASQVSGGFDGTEKFVGELLRLAEEAVAAGQTLGECYAGLYSQMEKQFGSWFIFEHCMPFNASRAFDEASGIKHPRIWTAERDMQMWGELEGAG